MKTVWGPRGHHQPPQAAKVPPTSSSSVRSRPSRSPPELRAPWAVAGGRAGASKARFRVPPRQAELYARVPRERELAKASMQCGRLLRLHVQVGDFWLEVNQQPLASLLNSKFVAWSGAAACERAAGDRWPGILSARELSSGGKLLARRAHLRSLLPAPELEGVGSLPLPSRVPWRMLALTPGSNRQACSPPS